MKKPWLAGLLNIIPGVGYLYVDIRRISGWYFVAADVFVIGGSMLSPSVSDASTSNTALSAGDWILTLGILIFWVGLIVDANLAAVAANKE